MILADRFESGDTSAWGQAWPPEAAYQGFRYDAFGNLIEIIGSPGRVINVNPATNRLTGAGISHDTAGNVTAWAGNSYTYGPFNETWKTNSSGDEWIHLFDANDQRVWSYGVAGTGLHRNRWTLRGLDDKVLREYSYVRDTEVWTLERELIYRGPGQLLAAATSEGERHFHLDHLGSPRLITNGSGAKVAFHSYFPYGEEATPLGQNNLRNKFTGHERDLGNPNNQADDLDYMHARYHNPLVARFLSVDPAGSSARTGAPQSWNRYAYTLGNPLRAVDPDGRETESAIPPPPGATGLASGVSMSLLQDGAVRGWYSSSVTGLPSGPTGSPLRTEPKAMARFLSSLVGAAAAEMMRPIGQEGQRAGGTTTRTSPRVNSTGAAFRVLGGAGVVLTVGTATASVVAASPGEAPRVAVEQGGGDRRRCGGLIWSGLLGSRAWLCWRTAGIAGGSSTSFDRGVLAWGRVRSLLERRSARSDVSCGKNGLCSTAAGPD